MSLKRKQTKNWQAAWLRKVKADEQTVGAEMAVLVNSARPCYVPPQIKRAYKPGNVLADRYEIQRVLAAAAVWH